MSRDHVTWAVLSVALLACKREPAPAPPPRAEPSAAPVTTATASASALASAPLPAIPARIGDVTIALHTVARSTIELPGPDDIITYRDNPGPRPFRIHALRDRMLVTSGGLVIHALEGGKLRPLEELEGQNLQAREGRERVFPSSAEHTIIESVSGRYPEPLFLRIQGSYTDGGRFGGLGTHTFERAGGRFVERPLPIAAAAWTGGMTLVLRSDELSVLGGTAPPPRRASTGACPVRVKAEALSALPSGEVLVVGTDCGAGGKLALERWPPGSAESSVVSLPAPEDKLRSALVAANEGDRFVAARFERGSFLARIGDPKAPAVQPLEPPSARPIAGMALSDDGCLWAMFGDAKGADLFRRDRLGGWTRAAFPKDVGPLQFEGMYATSCDVVYVAGGLTVETSVIVSSREGRILDEAPDGGPAGASEAAPIADAGSAKPAALSSGCASPFVVLFGLGKSAPPDYDYPATRDALAGWPERAKYRFVEYRYRGQRMFGARAPDQAAAEALADRIRDRVKGSKPAPACYAPAELIREVSFAGG
jgi:hypothetical protein